MTIEQLADFDSLEALYLMESDCAAAERGQYSTEELEEMFNQAASQH